MTSWHTRALCIPAGHPSAAGHFPGNPIVPGALLLDAVVAAIAGEGGVVIRAAKFLRPVRHGARVELCWQSAGENLFRFECRLAEGVALAGTLECAGGAW